MGSWLPTAHKHASKKEHEEELKNIEEHNAEECVPSCRPEAFDCSRSPGSMVWLRKTIVQVDPFRQPRRWGRRELQAGVETANAYSKPDATHARRLTSC